MNTTNIALTPDEVNALKWALDQGAVAAFQWDYEEAVKVGIVKKVEAFATILDKLSEAN